MIVVHIPPWLEHAYIPTFFEPIKVFYYNIFGRISVTALSCISGFLIYFTIVTLLSIIYPFVSLFGIMGAAYSMAIILGLSRGILQPIIISRVLKISLLSYCVNLLVPMLILTLVLGILYVGATNLGFTNENITVISFAIMQVVVATAAALYLMSKIIKQQS